MRLGSGTDTADDRYLGIGLFQVGRCEGNSDESLTPAAFMDDLLILRHGGLSSIGHRLRRVDLVPPAAFVLAGHGTHLVSATALTAAHVAWVGTD